MKTEKDRSLILNALPEDIVLKTGKKTKIWFKQLNNIIGATSFALALGCLGTNHPKIYGTISLIFIFAIVFTINNHFPSEIKELRNKKNKSDLEQVLLKGMEAHFLGFRKTLKEGIVYWVGIGFLLSVIIGLEDAITKFL